MAGLETTEKTSLYSAESACLVRYFSSFSVRIFGALDVDRKQKVDMGKSNLSI